MIEEFCDKDQVNTALGYSVCSVLCTTRSCCFSKGDDEYCYDDFKPWCDEFDSCNNIDGIHNVIDSHTDQSDGYIVSDVCNELSLQQEGMKGIKDCEEICSERYCCFIPGRMSCYDKKKLWCDEFEACTNLESLSFSSSSSSSSSSTTQNYIPTTSGGSSSSSIINDPP